MVVIVDFEMGNPGSVRNMLLRLGVDAPVTSQRDQIEAADGLILPGVGAFDTAIRNLRRLGLVDILQEQVVARHKPVLGICLGMQLFAAESEEGVLPGLGWIEGEVRLLRPAEGHPQQRLPHMGWNSIRRCRPDRLTDRLDDDHRFYFVHSYYIRPANPNAVAATSTYGGEEFAAVVSKDNVMGTQFHPEKSHKFGMQLLQQFVDAVA